MTEATTRAHIAGVLNGISNMGTVHTYERWSAEWDGFLAHFKTTISGTDYIRGWTITCPGWTQEYLPGSYVTDSGKAIILRRYTYKIRGYFGLSDANASETTALALIEDVCEALDVDADIHQMENTTDFWGEVPPAELTVFEPRTFGGTLCHYAEITQQIVEAVAL